MWNEQYKHGAGDCAGDDNIDDYDDHDDINHDDHDGKQRRRQIRTMIRNLQHTH